MEKSKISYAEAIGEVEQILERFNNEQMDIDEMGKQVKRAAELIRLCKERLHKVEKEVADILKEEE
ncbi:MAG TPA: exodeoxyribonuclease VII small subunit [Candidatus Alistipes merdigallinarum]|nr:exodeoxyribonuclease VII small subunit [Candidatus Alistipes merdigallinarum]